MFSSARNSYLVLDDNLCVSQHIGANSAQKLVSELFGGISSSKQVGQKRRGRILARAGQQFSSTVQPVA